jgi:hypothetical protein
VRFNGEFSFRGFTVGLQDAGILAISITCGLILHDSIRLSILRVGASMFGWLGFLGVSDWFRNRHNRFVETIDSAL